MAIEDLLKENIELMTALIAKLNSVEIPAKSKSRIAKITNPEPPAYPPNARVAVAPVKEEPVTPTVVADSPPKNTVMPEPDLPLAYAAVAVVKIAADDVASALSQPPAPVLPQPPSLLVVPTTPTGPTIDSVRTKLIKITQVYGTKAVEEAVAAFGATDLTELAADKLPSLDEWATAALAQVKP